MRKLRDRLEDVLEAIRRTEDAASEGRVKFDSDAKTQVWMITTSRLLGRQSGQSWMT